MPAAVPMTADKTDGGGEVRRAARVDPSSASMAGQHPGAAALRKDPVLPTDHLAFLDRLPATKSQEIAAR